jgi:hypothetical protein
MVQCIATVIKEYQNTLREMPYVPKTSFERESLGFSGEANKLFLTFLFSNHSCWSPGHNGISLMSYARALNVHSANSEKSDHL